MLTRSALGLLSSSLVLLVAGLPTGNLFLVTLALVPLVFLLLSGAGTRKAQIQARIDIPEHAVRVGDVVPVTVHYEARGGTGLLELHQGVPGIFVIEEGSNLHVVPKTPRPTSGRFTFRVRCTRRGQHTFDPTDWTLVPLGGLGRPASGSAGTARHVEVRPALAALRRSVRVRGKATRFLPDNDDARLGIQTTEFRDIRNYARGDPPKTVNWKATARIASRNAARPAAEAGPGHRIVPLVNEYEHEGRKSVWVYVDCGPYMRIGTSAENLFEVAVDAANRLIQHFTARAYRVGMTLYNRPEPLHLHPDTGTRQVLRAHEILGEVEPTETRGELPRAIEETKRHLLMGRCLVFVLTRAELADGTTEAGLRRLRNLTSRRTRRPPVIVASPDPLSLLPDQHAGTETARMIERHRQEQRIQELKRLGVTLLRWDPRQTRFEAALAHTVGDR